ncbi:MAG: T9SS type A sorting domain-containing protein [Saprospirales bacterium]|nr:T9SS type A sorting domain-containing protein [Saprospirales bacterium]
MKNFIYTIGLVLFTLSANAQLPAGWGNADLGTPGAPGVAAFNDVTGLFTIRGSGLNFWDTDDGHFAYVQIDGDFEFTARVVTFLSELGLGGAAKTGINARNSLAADAPSFIMAWEDWGGLAVTSREGPGITPVWTGTTNQPGADAIPWYLRVVRTGDDFKGYESLDNVTWTEVTVKTMSAMLPVIYVGLAISPNNLNEAVATFDEVTIVGNIVLGTDETQKLNRQLSLAPNPVLDELFVEIDQTVLEIRVSDLSGALLAKYAPQPGIDVSGLAPGMYLLQVATERGMAVQKFVKM